MPFVADDGADELVQHDKILYLMVSLPPALALKEPRYLDMASRIKTRFAEKYPKDELFVGSFQVGVSMMGEYFEGIQKAGSLDADKVMAAFRSGPTDTFQGTYNLTGIKTYGANCGFGDACVMGQISGDKNVYVSELPLTDLDDWSFIMEGTSE